MPDLKKEKPDSLSSDLIKIIAKEWQEGKVVNQSIYNKNSEKEKKRFKKQLLEFQKNGYYTKTKEKEEEIPAKGDLINIRQITKIYKERLPERKRSDTILM